MSQLIQVVLSALPRFVIVALTCVVALFILLVLRHLIFLILGELVLLVFVLLLALHELIKVVLKMHLLVCAVADLCLALAQEVYQEVASFVAIKNGMSCVLVIVMVLYISWRCTYEVRAVFGTEAVVSSRTRYTQRVLCCRL